MIVGILFVIAITVALAISWLTADRRQMLSCFLLFYTTPGLCVAGVVALGIAYKYSLSWGMGAPETVFFSICFFILALLLRGFLGYIQSGAVAD